LRNTILALYNNIKPFQTLPNSPKSFCLHYNPGKYVHVMLKLNVTDANNPFQQWWTFFFSFTGIQTENKWN